jgi:hypothetical protein
VRRHSHAARAVALVEAVRLAASDPPAPVRVLGAAPSLPGQPTERELQILSVRGEHHKQRIFGKLGLQNQAHAVSAAFRRGFITPEKVLQGRPAVRRRPVPVVPSRVVRCRGVRLCGFAPPQPAARDPAVRGRGRQPGRGRSLGAKQRQTR